METEATLRFKDRETDVDPNVSALIKASGIIHQSRICWLVTVLALLGGCLVTGCKKSHYATPHHPPGVFDADREPDAIEYRQLLAKLGPVPKVNKSYRIGVVVKFLGNQYWKMIADGMQSKADQYGISLDVQGASSESDQDGQVHLMESMIEKNYDAILFSPQTTTNLQPVVEKARKRGVVLVDVGEALRSDVEQYVGARQDEAGVKAAQYFLKQLPRGGKIAVIEGQDVYAARERTKGFKETLAGSKLDIVAAVSGDWDLQKALEVATKILEQHPDLKGFYCHNDIMALGAVEAVHNAGKPGKIIVIGTDGIGPAYDSIRAGELTGTVDTFPFITGQISVEVALRLLGGQAVPRVVYSVQDLVLKSNVDNPQPK